MTKHIVSIVLFLCLSGCTDKQPQKQTQRPLPFKALGFFPSKDSVAAPRTISLDSCPPPKTFSITDIPYAANAEVTDNNRRTNGVACKLKPAVFSVNMTNYEAEQGLYSLINTIKKDDQGNFWFGTGGAGVIRYDGKTAAGYTTAQGLASNNIRAIAEDKNGNFWFGSQGGGANFYDGHVFTKVTKTEGLSSNNIRDIIIDNTGAIWFATFGGGISIYNKQSFSYLSTKNGLSSNNVNCIIQSRRGTIWCGTDSGICSIESTANAQRSVNIYTQKNGLAGNRILSLAEDKYGAIWIGTDGGGLSQLNIGKDLTTAPIITTSTTINGLPDNRIKSVFADTKGKIWLCTPGAGAICFDPATLAKTESRMTNKSAQGIFTTYTSESGLSTNKIVCAAEDNNGNIWFGTDGGGVNRLDGEALTINISPRGASKATITCINADKTGNIWLSSSDSGIACYNGHFFRNYYVADIMKDNALMCMTEDTKGNLWFGTNTKGLLMSSDKPGAGNTMHFKAFGAEQGLSSSRISCLSEDNSGRIWLGTDAGVTCIDGKYVTNYTTAQGLGSNAVWCSLKDKDGNMWFGTFRGGMSKFISHPADGGAPRFITYTTTQGLASNSIKSLAQDKWGNIWVGTGGGGISRFDGSSFINYTTVDGLANNVVVSVAEDKNGNIWFGTNEGFAMLKGFKKNTDNNIAKNAGGEPNYLLPPDNNTANHDLAIQYTPVFESFNFKNGFPLKDLNNNALYIDTSGVIWAGTADKLVKFDYNKLIKNKRAPRVLINAIQIGGEKICWTVLKNNLNHRTSNNNTVKNSTDLNADSLAMINEELTTLGELLSPATRDSLIRKFGGITFDSITPFYPLPENLVLPYKNNNITFDFAAIELSRHDLVKYQYILEGYDKDWSPVTDRTSATFGNIHEGSYTFKLRAQSPDGVWSDAVTYSFEVLPPYYRTWWAYLLFCIGFICCIYVIMHFRIRLLKQENARLETIVHERTAQIEKEKAAVLRQANDLKTLNLFKDKAFSILSHDLRGPINTSATVISMLDDDRISINEFKTLKEGLVKQLTATGTLLENLLRWAKNSMDGSVQPHPQLVDICEIIVRNLTLFEENLKNKDINFINNVPPGTIAWCDAEHLDIVIRNLMANAIKFTEKNGTITVAANTTGSKVTLSVTDTGVGMTQEQLDKLFKPITDNTTYGTEGEKGTGLGLLLCFDFVQANKGQIEVISELNKGTTFKVTLPTGRSL